MKGSIETRVKAVIARYFKLPPSKVGLDNRPCFGFESRTRATGTSDDGEDAAETMGSDGEDLLS